MSKGLDLSPVFHLRNNFTVIGLTGRTGSGYAEIAAQLSKGFDEKIFPSHAEYSLKHNSYKKYKIVYNYASHNFKEHVLIKYRDIITLYLLKYPFNELISFLKSEDLQSHLRDSKFEMSFDFSSEIDELVNLKSEYENLTETISKINWENNTIETWGDPLYNLYSGGFFSELSDKLHSSLQKVSFVKHNLVMEKITTNIRKCGEPFVANEVIPEKIFGLAELINYVIKSIRKQNKKDKSSTKIVIDSFRNPLEIMYFKQRYAAFYLIAVNRENSSREEHLRQTYKGEYENVRKILELEYKGGKGKEFYRQYVMSCIEKADIHISFRDQNETEELNKEKKENDLTTPFFSWQMQLLKYLALIDHPGLITPSPEERCMQLAYTAKYNSGCISRQVGAAICDENYSIKAIGWNNTPEGHVPCLMRDAKALLNPDNFKGEPEEIKAFTPYEKTNKDFQAAFKKHYQNAIVENEQNLKGRNVCICFKSLQNSCAEGKNQVHTRALHAEESAFLQITKYGGTAIKNGKLFTTASPCELCAKKAYQLGIKVIYYIAPYPGISTEQILDAGAFPPELRLFNGAIGNAYHWLYEPFMAYKDELSLLLGIDIKDKTTQLENEIKDLKLRLAKHESNKAIQDPEKM